MVTNWKEHKSGVILFWRSSPQESLNYFKFQNESTSLIIATISSAHIKWIIKKRKDNIFPFRICSIVWVPTCGISNAMGYQFKVMYFMNLIFYKFLQYCLGSTASKIQFHWSAPTNTGKVSSLLRQIAFCYRHCTLLVWNPAACAFKTESKLTKLANRSYERQQERPVRRAHLLSQKEPNKKKKSFLTSTKLKWSHMSSWCLYF